MALNADVRKTLVIRLEEYEGRCPHLYLDSVGCVTVGVGHLIRNRAEMTRLMMMTGGCGVPTRSATPVEKWGEFDSVSKLPKGHRAGWY